MPRLNFLRKRGCAKTVVLAALALVSSTILSEQTCAQISEGGVPLSYLARLVSEVPVETLPAVNVDSLLEIDAIEEAEGKPYRFGFEIPVSLNLQNAGVWDTLETGGRIWRLGIRSTVPIL